MRYVFPIVPAGTGPLWFLGAISALLLALVVLFAWITWSSRHAQFTISPEGLRVRGDLYGRMIPAAALLVDEARPLDLRREPERGPASRRLGTGLPGFASGWFRLRNGEKALIYLTDRSRVVYVPTRDGYALLLSVAAPDEFVRRLKQMVEG
jgi:hypothetical protein